MAYDHVIITVDDSSTMRRIIKNTLQKLGFNNILEAGNGIEGLNVMAKNKIDLLITDWNMPEMDGLTFVKAVRAKPEYKELPILMVTTEAAKEDILTALRNGVNNYIVKPFTPETLQEKVFKLFRALVMHEIKDLSELIEIAKKINSGEYDLTSISVEPEHALFEIVQFFNEAIKKLSTIKDAVEDSYEDLPVFEKVLKEVIADTKKASEKLLNLTDNVNFNINEIRENMDLLKQCVNRGDFKKSMGIVDRLVDKTVEGQDISFDMIATLEFQDINKQKIDKLLKIVTDLERRLTDLIIKLGLKTNKIDVETLNKIEKEGNILNNQDLVNQLLKEFGL